MLVQEVRENQKEEKNQGVGHTTAGRRRTTGAAFHSAGGNRLSLGALFLLTGDGLARHPCNRPSPVPSFPLQVPPLT